MQLASSRSRVWHRLLVLCCVVSTAGCATYSERMEAARLAASRGDYASGVQELNDFIGPADESGMPEKFGSETGLAILERAILEQALAEFEASSRDFELADKELELLDLTSDGLGTIGKYVYSDSSTSYRTSPAEKLALNGFNLMNYLGRGDLRGARVEAKRFTVMREYIESLDIAARGESHAAFGSYLAGFVHERLEEWGTAMLYYDEALASKDFASLAQPVARGAGIVSRRPPHVQTYMERNGIAAKRSRAGAARPAELLVVVNTGRVPYKVPKRIAAGAAIGLAHGYITGDTRVLERAATKVIVYPELVPGVGSGRTPGLLVDGEEAGLELASDLGAEIQREYERIKGGIIGAALSRMIVRAAASEAARVTAKEAGGNAGAQLLAGLLVEGALVAMDKPDTRSWQFLPDKVFVHRQTIAPGRHTVRVRLEGDAVADALPREVEVDVPADGFAAVIVTAPR